MLKRLLYLYNDGHNPFPKLNSGGLGYHLPQYKKRMHGDGVYERDDGEGFIGHPQERFRGIDLKGIYSNFFVEGEFNSNQVEPCGNCCHFCLLFAVRLLPQITQVGINYQ